MPVGLLSSPSSNVPETRKSFNRLKQATVWLRFFQQTEPPAMAALTRHFARQEMNEGTRKIPENKESQFEAALYAQFAEQTRQIYLEGAFFEPWVSRIITCPSRRLSGKRFADGTRSVKAWSNHNPPSPTEAKQRSRVSTDATFRTIPFTPKLMAWRANASGIEWTQRMILVC